MNDDRLLSVQDVINVIAEHMNALDQLWPDSEPHAPRKVHIVELIDAIKLRLLQRAEKNASQYESPFEKAAKKITGTQVRATLPSKEVGNKETVSTNKSTMQLAHEAAQARMRGQKQ